jgi:cysteinyl-tRNA synthetase
LDDDLNTAEALAAVYEYIREANSAMDSGDFREGNAAAAADLLARFDRVFDLLKPFTTDGAISDEEVDGLIDERYQARKAKNFARSDEIRQALLDRGVILEDTKEGTRWKRK